MPKAQTTPPILCRSGTWCLPAAAGLRSWVIRKTIPPQSSWERENGENPDRAAWVNGRYSPYIAGGHRNPHRFTGRHDWLAGGGTMVRAADRAEQESQPEHCQCAKTAGEPDPHGGHQTMAPAFFPSRSHL